jgi:hypothetical protein
MGTKKVVDSAYVIFDELQRCIVEKVCVRKYTLKEYGEWRLTSHVGGTPFPRGKNIGHLRDADRQSNQVAVEF